eukprot:scaffold2876_cov123-Isochrysis_galbana.AAC.4
MSMSAHELFRWPSCSIPHPSYSMPCDGMRSGETPIRAAEARYGRPAGLRSMYPQAPLSAAANSSHIPPIMRRGPLCGPRGPPASTSPVSPRPHQFCCLFE